MMSCSKLASSADYAFVINFGSLALVGDLEAVASPVPPRLGVV